MKKMVDLLFMSTTLQRWNDLIRPSAVGIREVDNQGHKINTAYMLAMHIEEYEGVKVNWQNLIEGLIFEYVLRVVLTDIKPSVFNIMMSKKGNELKHLVLKTVDLEDKGLNQRFEEYLLDNNYASKEKEILNVAQILVTKWEFDILYPFNTGMYTIKEYRSDIDKRYQNILSLPYVKEFVNKEYYNEFLKITGQARIQKRWSRFPMNPEISILGHMFMVAVMSYISSLHIGCCKERLRNNFLDGLFHDLPEVFTRDIASPIKKSVEGLDKIIKDIEISLINSRLNILPSIIKSEITNFVGEEFTSRIFISEQEEYKNVSSEEIHALYNKDEFCAIDGELVKEWDLFFAYMEARISIENGTTHAEIRQICEQEYNKKKSTILCGIDFGCLYEAYKI